MANAVRPQSQRVEVAGILLFLPERSTGPFDTEGRDRLGSIGKPNDIDPSLGDLPLD
jgi:hypothetical protein